MLALSSRSLKPAISAKRSTKSASRARVFASTANTEEARAALIQEFYTKFSAPIIEKMTPPDLRVYPAPNKHINKELYIKIISAVQKAIPDMIISVTTNGKVDAEGYVPCTVFREGHHKGVYAPFGSSLPPLEPTGKFVKPSPMHVRVKVDAVDGVLMVTEIFIVQQAQQKAMGTPADELYLMMGGKI